jgi:hypothetical protein
MFWTPAFAGVTPQGTFYEFIKYKISAKAGENSLFRIVIEDIDRVGGAGDREAEGREAGAFGSGWD